jgi:very-short-patch-repair endonuclease
MSPRNDTDLRIGALARAQHGPVAHRQLRALGLSHEQIAYRLRVGRLIRRHPAVYLVGHEVLTREGRWMAAVLASGDGALLSHFDAGAHLDLLPTRGERVHVSRPSTSGRAPDPRWIRLHRVGTLRPWEGTVVDGIPTTTVARTLLDLARHLHPAALEQVVERAIRRHRFDLGEVTRCLREHPRQPGAPRLRALLQDLATRDAAHLRSVLERDFLALCHDRGLPRPAVNAHVEGLEVDVLWPSRRLVVELDGYAYHGGRAAFERDRERDQRLTLAGYTVLRVTYRQLHDTPELLVRRLRRLLEG